MVSRALNEVMILLVIHLGILRSQLLLLLPGPLLRDVREEVACLAVMLLMRVRVRFVLRKKVKEIRPFLRTRLDKLKLKRKRLKPQSLRRTLKNLLIREAKPLREFRRQASWELAKFPRLRLQLVKLTPSLLSPLVWILRKRPLARALVARVIRLVKLRRSYFVLLLPMKLTLRDVFAERILSRAAMMNVRIFRISPRLKRMVLA